MEIFVRILQKLISPKQTACVNGSFLLHYKQRSLCPGALTFLEYGGFSSRLMPVKLGNPFLRRVSLVEDPLWKVIFFSLYKLSLSIIVHEEQKAFTGASSRKIDSLM